MTFLWAVLIGLALGAISALVTQRRNPGLIVVRSILGILCSVIAVAIADWIAPIKDSNLWVPVIGVAILLVLWFLVTRVVTKSKKV